MRENGNLIRTDLGPVPCENNFINNVFLRFTNKKMISKSPFYREAVHFAHNLSFDAHLSELVEGSQTV